MDDDAWMDELTADVLAERYGISVDSVEWTSADSESVNRRVLTADGRRLRVAEYATSVDVNLARAAWDMSEFCRAADLPVPRVWPDRDGDLVAVSEGSAWAVADDVLGRADTRSMTMARAESMGTVLGRMHRVLAAYPFPELTVRPDWRTMSPDEGVAECAVALETIRQRDPRDLAQVRGRLLGRQLDLVAHTDRLRAGLPAELTDQAVHGDFACAHVFMVADSVTGVLNFRSVKGSPVWELGRAAFDPFTVAHRNGWQQFAVRMIEAYRSQNPTLPHTEACARVALLDMLYGFHSATPSDDEPSEQSHVGLEQYWGDRQVAIRRLLASLDEIEAALTDVNQGR
ncbi:phosphotransferase [Streptomyces sp. S.PB5]|uniref:phosphotransferase enzyme family protein n=1 Tax=Streptomyces sp. S.PB5 TaxID=3020844 RepID=UPI0025AF6421|nr:phosphotransferase [Streptomyces sp. S.PB5]MDN3025664.1 phosphotransferase [Streptomyces sp. S.PB5]